MSQMRGDDEARVKPRAGRISLPGVSDERRTHDADVVTLTQSGDVGLGRHARPCSVEECEHADAYGVRLLVPMGSDSLKNDYVGALGFLWGGLPENRLSA
jgi:hypothetical protein